MIHLGPHAVFIVWGYAGAVLAVAALVAWTALESRRVKARLKALEDAGIRRRSAGTAS